MRRIISKGGSMSKTIIALVYDFDKTLCTKDMQEYTFIPNLGIKASDFWHEVEEIASLNKMDKTLAYLYMMIKKSKELGHDIRREDFNSCGKDIEYFKGVEEWFDRINQYGNDLGVQIEHYIISSGNKEIIENSIISKYFKKIFASEFLYIDDKAVWPAIAVNYTTKTQFLFRINKGVLDIYDDISLNKKMVEDERRISNKNIIYIGDGITDIPCMTMTHKNGGYSIAVYRENNDSVAYDLLEDGRVDFVSLADYSDGSHLDKLVKGIIDKMAITSELHDEHKRQLIK